MLVECDTAVLKALSESERYEEYKDVKCFIKKESNFNIYIFINIYEDTKSLRKGWKALNNDIAWYFQAKLDKEIERWNLYIIYFAKSEVDKSLQYEIEQNKYCSRKIVMDNLGEEDNEDILKKVITDKLFEIELGSQKRGEQGNLIDIIRDNDNYLFNLLEAGLEDDAILDNYLKGETNET